MTQPISSRGTSATGIKSKINNDLYPILEYDMETTRNSVGLVHPFVLESFFQDTCTALELSKKKTTLIAPKNSPKTINLRKNEESKVEAFSNRARSIENITLNSKKDVNSTDNVANTKKEVLPTRVLRSAGKYAEFNRELKSVNDFSIENIDWYYEDENYYKKKLQVVFSDFAIPKENRREGNEKLFYTYLLLDSRKCRNKANISWLDFIEAIFYIGKGKNDRALKHAEEAEKASSPDKKKCLKIKEIWDSGNPIKVFFVTENIIAEEAFTREAAMIEAIGLRRLCNRIHGSYYGVAVTMKSRERLELGATLLVEARNIFRWKKVVEIYSKKKTVIVPFVRPKGATTLIDSKESLKNEEAMNEAATNKSMSTVIPYVEQKKQLGMMTEQKPSSSCNRTISKTVNNNSMRWKIIITKAETDETKKQTLLECKDNTAKKTSNFKKNEVLPTRDYSIENMDWYYKNENDYKKKLSIVLNDFSIPKKNRREGNEKLCYNFLLLDSRKCKNKTNISWLDFIEAIFYIGKGKNDRAIKLVGEADRASNKTSSKELFIKIKDIWNSGSSVNVFLVTESIIAEEAFTRSAAMIDAISLNRLCNKRRGSYYEKAKTMEARECFELGITLLIEARDKFNWKKTIDVYPKNKPAIISLVRSYS